MPTITPDWLSLFQASHRATSSVKRSYPNGNRIIISGSASIDIEREAKLSQRESHLLSKRALGLYHTTDSD